MQKLRNSKIIFEISCFLGLVSATFAVTAQEEVRYMERETLEIQSFGQSLNEQVAARLQQDLEQQTEHAFQLQLAQLDLDVTERIAMMVDLDPDPVVDTDISETGLAAVVPVSTGPDCLY